MTSSPERTYVDAGLPKGHNGRVNHVSWDSDPTTDGLVTLTVLLHEHFLGQLGTLADPNSKMSRIYEAVAEINSAHIHLDGPKFPCSCN